MVDLAYVERHLIMADPEETAALRRDAAAVAAEASKLLLQLRGQLAEKDVVIPADLDAKLYAWLARHVAK